MDGPKANVEVYSISRAPSDTEKLRLLPLNFLDSIASRLHGSEVPNPRAPTLQDRQWTSGVCKERMI